MGWVLIRTLLSLSAVIGLMFATVLFLKKFFVGKGSKNVPLMNINILGQRVIQPKNSVVVLKTFNKILVVGISDKGMHPLTEITDRATIIEVEQELDNERSEPQWIFWKQNKKSNGFAKYFGQIWNRIDHHKSGMNAVQPPASSEL